MMKNKNFANFMDAWMKTFRSGQHPIPKDTKTDAEYIKSDWEAVGDDLRKAFGEYSKKD